MYAFNTMDDYNLSGQRLLIREDLNVPIQNGKITSDKRIRAVIPTLTKAVKTGARVMVMSHLGRPIEGLFDDNFSLAPVAERLSELLGLPVRLDRNWLMGSDVSPGEIVLCENVRFYEGEKINSAELAKKMADICDLFVMDSFATSHRAHASTAGVAGFAPKACAGPLLVNELEHIGRALNKAARPVVGIVGGAKVSTKLSLLRKMAQKVDYLIVGGGIANTFIAAQGYGVGESLCEHELVPLAHEIMHAEEKNAAKILIPQDVIVQNGKESLSKLQSRLVGRIKADEKIFDIGPQTILDYASIIKQAGTILWNGPVGVFEQPQYANGTRVIGEAIAKSKGFSIAGGGDTLAVIDKYDLASDISYISTGGGAFLTMMEGRPLPAVVALEKRMKGECNE